MYKEQRKKSAWGSLFRPREKPTFTFKAMPIGLAGQPAPLLPYAYMPTTMLALDDLASLLAAYRLTLALQLGRQVRCPHIHLVVKSQHLFTFFCIRKYRSLSY